MNTDKEVHEVVVTTRYFVDDPKFSGDYCEKIISINGETAVIYGPLQDDGCKPEGFIEGIEYAFGPSRVKVTRVNVADYDG